MATIDLYKPQFMMKMVKQITPFYTFLKDTFFRRKQTFITESVMFDVQKNGLAMAPFVSKRIGGTVLEREGFRTEEFTPPLVGPMRMLTSDVLEARLPGEAVFSGRSPNTRKAEILQNDMRELDESITRREEWMVAQALFQGEILAVGQGVRARIDFEFENNMLAPVPWADHVNADPLRDLRDARRIAARSGYSPNVLIADTKTIDDLIDNDRLQRFLDNSGMRIGIIEPRFMRNGGQYHGFLRQVGLDVYSYDGEFVDNENENPDRPGVMPGERGFVPKVYDLIPSGKVFIGSTSMPTRMLYGGVNHIIEIGAKDEPRVPHSWFNDMGTVRSLVMYSRPLPCPLNVSSWVILDVVGKGG